jgi:P-type conjugative transfer protein TrbG
MIRTHLLFASMFAFLCVDASTAHAQSSAHAVAPLSAIAQANASARRRPAPGNFHDAVQLYDYVPGAIYEIYGAPGFVSTVLLEPGEVIVTIAAGDTERWMVEEAVGGDLAHPRALLLLKPTRATLRTNIVLVTDRRTYSIEAVAGSGQIYSAQTAWTYSADTGASLVGGSVAGEHFNFAYRIQTARGRTPRWRPIRVFDDGRKTFIEFPAEIAASELPPLFVTDSGEAALVNYRVSGNFYVIDRLFDEAELRLGADRPTIVRLRRNAPSAAPLTNRLGERS